MAIATIPPTAPPAMTDALLPPDEPAVWLGIEVPMTEGFPVVEADEEEVAVEEIIVGTVLFSGWSVEKLVCVYVFSSCI